MKFFTVAPTVIIVLVSNLASAVPVPADYASLSTRDETFTQFGTRGLVFDDDLEFELAIRGGVLSKIKPHPDRAANHHTGSPKPETPQGSRARPIANGKKDDYFGWVGSPSRVQGLSWYSLHKVNGNLLSTVSITPQLVRAKEGNRSVTTSSTYYFRYQFYPLLSSSYTIPVFPTQVPKSLKTVPMNIPIPFGRRTKQVRGLVSSRDRDGKGTYSS